MPCYIIYLFITEFKITDMKNPDWNREEIILALDLYFNLDYGQMHGKNLQVVKLSEELRRMNIHQKIADPESFRSVNSVALKLNNIKKLDQNFGGKGMRDGGKLEREIWNEFYRHRDKLKKEAVMIRLMYLNPVKDKKGKETDEAHRNLIYNVHKNREADPIALKLKLEMVFEKTGLLKCDICECQPATFYGELGSHVLEIHYQKQLEISPGLEPAEMEDFIIVCPNCHSILDKHYSLIDADDLRTLIIND